MSNYCLSITTHKYMLVIESFL